MFSGLQNMPPSDAELATQALTEEGLCRFPSFSASDALTLVRPYFLVFNFVMSNIGHEGSIHPKTIPGNNAAHPRERPRHIHPNYWWTHTLRVHSRRSRACQWNWRCEFG